MITIGILAVARQGNGGTLLYTVSMLGALARLRSQGFRIVVFAAPDNHEFDRLGLPIVRVGGPMQVLAQRLTGRNPFGAVDMLFAPVHSMTLLVCGRPFVFTLHDLQERYYPKNFSLAVRTWRLFINAALTARARFVVCESDFVRRDIVKFIGVSEVKVAVVAAPPISTLSDDASDDAAVSAVRSKFSLPARYVFYPAQFWRHKNHRRLVEAFALVLKQHPDCVLVLTGKKRDEFDSVFARVRELGITDQVRHIGYVEQSELAALYRSATVAAIPTLFESISIPVYEAFALGTAVCASSVVALPEQIGDAGLLFDPNSVQDIAEKICTLLASPDLRSRLIARGHARMASVTHEHYAAQLAKVALATSAQRSAAA